MTIFGVIKVIGGLVIILGLAGGLVWWKISEPAPEPETPAVVSADVSVSPPLKTLVVAAETYTCTNGTCNRTTAPPSGTDPVTDGEWWYYYASDSPRESKRPEPVEGREKIYLRRKNNASGKVETIMESTPLTSPRGLYLSPNGDHLAFWLDNVDKPEEELTELWVYDVEDGGIRLLAEKLYRPDVRSEVFWNSEATFLWFVADTGEQSLSHDVLELILVNADSPGKRAVFKDVPWADIVEDVPAATIDLTQQADALTYTTKNFLGAPVLVVQKGQEKQRTNLRGEMKYTQWLEDGSLLYALQDDRGFTFWGVREGVHKLIARRNGTLLSARSDSSGDHLVFATSTTTATNLSSLHSKSGRVRQEGSIPNQAGPVRVVWVESTESSTGLVGADVTNKLQDAELAAFFERNFAAITGETTSQPLRLIATSEANTMYIDYRTSTGEEHRLLVKVHDAVNTEWSIKSRYIPVNREWKKVQGGGLADPKPQRLYEWEPSLKQWILKTSALVEE